MLASLWKRLVAPIAAVAVLALAPVSAQAAPIAFYTTGEFGDFGGTAFAGSATVVNGTAAPLIFPFAGASSVDVGGSKLTYTYSGPQVAPMSPGNVSFGSFTVSSTSLTPQSFEGLDFRLNIYQIAPGVAQGSLVGSATGNLQLVNSPFGNVPNSTIVVTFDPNTIHVGAPGGVLYTIEPPAGVVTVSSTGPSFIEGTAAAVPLPGVAWAGMALFGALGGSRGLKKLRRRREVVAA